MAKKEAEEVPPCELTDAELAWLWPRYARCRFPVASFPKRFARNELSQLSPKGKNMAVKLAYQYRRQIFQKSEKWDQPKFIRAVRMMATPQGETPPLFKDNNLLL